jgi:hypothetical protein
MIFFVCPYVFPSHLPLRYNSSQTTVTYKHTLKRPILMQYIPISIYNPHMEKGRKGWLNNFYGFSCNLFLSYSNLDI